MKSYLEAIVNHRWKYAKQHGGQFWISQEEPLGQYETKEWANRSVENLWLYAEVLETMDLNHEVTQVGDIQVITEKWKGNKQCIIPVAAYITLPTQFGSESLIELFTEAEFVENFDDWKEFFANLIVNRYSIRSCVSELGPDLNGPLWEALYMDDLSSQLSEDQLRMLEASFKKQYLYLIKQRNLDVRSIFKVSGLSHKLI